MLMKMAVPTRPLVVLVAGGLGETLHRRRLVGHGRGDLLRRQPGFCQAFGQGDVRSQHVDDGDEVGVVIGVDRLVDDDDCPVVEDGQVGVTGVHGVAGGRVVVHGGDVDPGPDGRSDRVVAVDRRRIGLSDDGQVDLRLVAATGEVGDGDDRGDGDDADGEQDPEALGAESLGDLPAGDEGDGAVEDAQGRSPASDGWGSRIVGVGTRVLVGGATDEVEEDLGERSPFESEAADGARSACRVEGGLGALDDAAVAGGHAQSNGSIGVAEHRESGRVELRRPRRVGIVRARR